jgi:predicted ATP-dependent endonuclease of OLD family
MKLKRLWINGFKNLNEFELNFENKGGITVLIGNNGSGKSNLLEAISAIFVGLFKHSTPQKRPNFEYEIEYILDDKTIYIEQKKVVLASGNEEFLYKFKIDDVEKRKNQFLSNFDYLPSHIIASYSGEESRLWDLYYEKFYKDYTKLAINPTGQVNELKMIYVNKYHWKIAFLLLTVYQNETDNFIEDILKINSIESVDFQFNTGNFTRFTNQTGDILRLARSLNPSTQDNVSFTNLDDIKTIFQNFGHEKDIFLLLVGAFLPKTNANKLISDIDIKFKKSDILLDVNCLSEGEKKLILVKMILEYLSFEKALILLDEPDSHIHIQNKKVFKDLIASYGNRFSILTTHSPTLTHSFDDKHITMINQGQIEDKNKQEIFSQITDGIWNYQEQSIFLSSTKNIILLVEGKHDKIHIEEAFKRLKSEYEELNFDIFQMNGEANIKNMILGLANNGVNFDDKKIIAIFDNDKAGKSTFSDFKHNDPTKNYRQLIDNTGSPSRVFFSFLLPKRVNFQGDFTIENMYIGTKYKNSLNNVIQRRVSDDEYFNKFVDDISKGIKEDAKNQLAEDCKEFNSEDFIHFRPLFSLIKDITIQEEIIEP